MDRETLDVDILIVGGGPAGLSAALRLAQLQKQSAAAGPEHVQRFLKDFSASRIKHGIVILDKFFELLGFIINHFICPKLFGKDYCFGWHRCSYISTKVFCYLHRYTADTA